MISSFEIPLHHDFDSDWLLLFLGARLVPGLESLNAYVYHRSLWINDSATVLSITVNTDSLSISWTGSVRQGAVDDAVRKMFSLDHDLSAFLTMASRDPILAPLVARRPGIRLPVYADPFEGTIRAILGQQVSVAATRTLTARLVERFGETAPHGSAVSRMFPLPTVIADASLDNVRAIGLTSAKASTLISTAKEVVDGPLDFERLRTLPGEEIEAQLIKLPGIGPWTAQYLRMRIFGDQDSLPSGDLVVRKAIQRLMLSEKLMSSRDVAALAERWKPWRSYATLHLWNSMSNPEP